MEKKVIENRGGKREGAGRPVRDINKGKMNRHNITMHDDIWDSIVENAAKLNLSASQYIAMIHKEYINNN